MTAQRAAPTGNDWNAAIQLRDAARAEILRLCGEPDLSEETALPPKRPGAAAGNSTEKEGQQ